MRPMVDKPSRGIVIPPEAVESQTRPEHSSVQIGPDASMPLIDTPAPEQRDDWDILKAIVYGGLVESITSLSVVSAAASSGARTCKASSLLLILVPSFLHQPSHMLVDLQWTYSSWA